MDGVDDINETVPGVEQFSLAGSTALVTGASSGIGRGIAVALAAAGAQVGLLARRSEELERTAKAARTYGVRACCYVCDVTSAEQVQAAVGDLCEGMGVPDILVNNAGHPIFNALFVDHRPDGWARVIELNLTAVARMCHLLGPRMIERGSGSVINIASITAHRPWPAMAAYSAAKAGVVALTQVLAQEWARLGVRVNAISPGWIESEINHRLMNDSLAYARVAEDVPMARWGRPEDVAGAVIWLASTAAGYVTGANITVDGGQGCQIPIDWRAYHIGRGLAAKGAAEGVDA